MPLDSVSHLAYLTAGILSAVLTAILFGQVRRKNIPLAFVLAAALQTCWLLTIILSSVHGFVVSIEQLLLAEGLRYCAWVGATFVAIHFYCKNRLPLIYRIALFIVCFLCLSIDALFLMPKSPLSSALTPYFVPEGFLVIQGLVLSIVALLSVEQLYRNVLANGLAKLFSLNLALMFVYDIYYFSQTLVKPELDPMFMQLRAVFVLVASLFMCISAMSLQNEKLRPTHISLSRPIVFYTASSTIAGTLLLVVALGGYYVGSLGGDWGFVAYASIFLMSLMAICMVFASRTVRERLRVFINKHLFSHKYDYRQEWLKLIDKLSRPVSHAEVHHLAIDSIASIFNCNGGALWLHKGKVFAPVHQYNIPVNIQEAIEPDDSPFVGALAHSEWVFMPFIGDDHGQLSQNNHLLPAWAKDENQIWLILPLLNERELIGFMALTPPLRASGLNWEDLDLVKTVGQQVANYLARHEQLEELAQARQFEAFNKLSAYVMHDLKNLIAQQALVVKNAEKHKDNPAFVEDAVKTINNSVTRMSHLLRKLQRNEPEGVSVLELHEALLEAIRRCQKHLPHPTLNNPFPDLQLRADWESLTMVFVHIIRNAQDATLNNGFIDVNVSIDDKRVRISFEDNGQGMAPEFVRDRLFKPFETTKSGTGMGIGVHQVRDYIEALGGQVEVESALGEGTNFRVLLPVERIDG